MIVHLVPAELITVCRDMLSKDTATQMQLGSTREFTHTIILLVARAVVVAATKTERHELGHYILYFALSIVADCN